MNPFPNLETKNKNLIVAIAVTAISYFMISYFMGSFLNYDFFRSDVASYWRDSLNWQQPFHPFHVPGYPLIIAAFRGLTFGKIYSVSLMMFISFLAYLISIILIYFILRDARVSSYMSGIGAILFGLWPFVGVVEAVNPRADFLAIAMYLAGLLLLQRRRLFGTAIIWGLALLTHKAIWIFIGFATIATFIIFRRQSLKTIFIFGILLIVPISILWFFGMLHHDSATWLLSANIQNEVASRSGLPILDGLLGTVFEGDIKNLLKGGMMIALTIITFFTLMGIGILGETPYKQNGVAISASILLMFVILNQHEIWAALRYSRLLVIPIMWLLSSRESRLELSRFLIPATLVPFFLILFTTQLGYAWYFVRVYFQ